MGGTKVPANGSWVLFLAIGCVVLVVGIVLLVVAGLRGRQVVDPSGRRGGVGLAATGGVATLVAFALLALATLVGSDNATRDSAAQRAADTLPQAGTAVPPGPASIPTKPPTKYPATLRDVGLQQMTQSKYATIARETASQMEKDSGSAMGGVVGAVYTKDGKEPYALVASGRLVSTLPAAQFVSGVLSGAKVDSPTKITVKRGALSCGQASGSDAGQTVCSWSDGAGFLIIDFFPSKSLTEFGKETMEIQADSFTN